MPDTRSSTAHGGASASETLAFTSVPEAETPHRLLGLHGIYGRGRNWTTMARELHTLRPEWSTLLIDLRLHGDSPAFDPPHTVDSAAADLARLEAATGLHGRAVLGHSFGGKVALAHALTGLDHLEQAWIIDSTPEVKEPAGTAWRMLDLIGGLPGEFARRADGVKSMTGAGLSRPVARWMASNLVFEEGRYVWRLDFDGMEALLRDFFARDLWEVVESPPEGLDVHFVRATASHVLSDTAQDRIRAAGARHGRAHLHDVEGGHWLHVDNPRAVLELLSTHLP